MFSFLSSTLQHAPDAVDINFVSDKNLLTRSQSFSNFQR